MSPGIQRNAEFGYLIACGIHIFNRLHGSIFRFFGAVLVLWKTVFVIQNLQQFVSSRNIPRWSYHHTFNGPDQRCDINDFSLHESTRHSTPCPRGFPHTEKPLLTEFFPVDLLSQIHVKEPAG